PGTPDRGARIRAIGQPRTTRIRVIPVPPRARIRAEISAVRQRAEARPLRRIDKLLVDAVDLREARATAAGADQFLHRGGVAVDDRLDRAVRAVADPAGHAELGGRLNHPLPESD